MNCLFLVYFCTSLFLIKYWIIINNWPVTYSESIDGGRRRDSAPWEQKDYDYSTFKGYFVCFINKPDVFFLFLWLTTILCCTVVLCLGVRSQIEVLHIITRALMDRKHNTHPASGNPHIALNRKVSVVPSHHSEKATRSHPVEIRG